MGTSLRLLIFLAAGLLTGCRKPEPAAPPAATGTRPAPAPRAGAGVGSPAPGFRLKDQTGADRSLDELRKKGPVAIVFYRSARW